MEIGAVVDDRAADRDADRAAEVAHHVEQSAGVFQPLRRQAAEAEVDARRHREDLRKAAQHCGSRSSAAPQSWVMKLKLHIARPKEARPNIISQRVSNLRASRM